MTTVLGFSNKANQKALLDAARVMVESRRLLVVVPDSWYSQANYLGARKVLEQALHKDGVRTAGAPASPWDDWLWQFLKAIADDNIDKAGALISAMDLVLQR